MSKTMFRLKWMQFVAGGDIAENGEKGEDYFTRIKGIKTHYPNISFAKLFYF